LGAKIKVTSPDGERVIESDEFFVDYFVTAISQDEILTEIELKKRPNTGSAFSKLGRLSADFAVVNAAATTTLGSNGKVEDLRVAMGAVASTPIRLKSVEDALRGKEASRDAVVNASKAAAEVEATPSVHASTEYKKKVMPVIVRDAVLSSIERARGGSK
jgi:aerobic carbon-monoxide dehydrogenase medium subunit